MTNTIYVSSFALMADLECLHDDGVRDWELGDLAWPNAVLVGNDLSKLLDESRAKAALEWVMAQDATEAEVETIDWTDTTEPVVSQPQISDGCVARWTMSSGGNVEALVIVRQIEIV